MKHKTLPVFFLSNSFECMDSHVDYWYFFIRTFISNLSWYYVQTNMYMHFFLFQKNHSMQPSGILLTYGTYQKYRKKDIEGIDDCNFFYIITTFRGLFHFRLFWFTFALKLFSRKMRSLHHETWYICKSWY